MEHQAHDAHDPNISVGVLAEYRLQRLCSVPDSIISIKSTFRMALASLASAVETLDR